MRICTKDEPKIRMTEVLILVFLSLVHKCSDKILTSLATTCCLLCHPSLVEH